MSDSKPKLLNLVKDLIGTLDSKASYDGHVNAINQMSFPTISNEENTAITQKSLQQLSQNSPNRDKLREKFDALTTTVPHIGQTTQLLAFIAGDSKMKDFLSRHSRKANAVQQSSTALESVSQSLSAPTVVNAADKVSEDSLKKSRAVVEQVLKAAGTFCDPEVGVDECAVPKSQHLNHRAPTMCDWYMKRPHLQTDFVIDAPTFQPFHATLAPIPNHGQSNEIIEDLLAVMEGVETDLIVSNPLERPYEPRTFTISDSIEPSVREIVQNMLPVASYYSIIRYFIHEKSQFQYGQVNHALCSAMSNTLKEYIANIARLERMLLAGMLNLQKMWFYVQPILATMKILADIAVHISNSNAIGGKVLSLLHEVTASQSGNSASHEICLFLIQTASVPYMEILQKWVYNGVICDPYREFLVEDNESVDREMLLFDCSADYWEKRYTICRERVPVFLERAAEVILRTGKYLNVIQQCGVDVKSPQADEIIYTVTERHYVEAIEKAYSFASETLLNLLLKDYDLIGRLRSVKHYFLLDQGDFIVQLMDSCEGELCKNIDDIIPTRLESLLELVLRTSAANGDPYKDDMRTQLLPFDVYDQTMELLNTDADKVHEYQPPASKKYLTGMKSFTFDYKVTWPVSLVLNRKAIGCYQMIFRHLFYCKHVERTLCKVWICDKVIKCCVRTSSTTYTPAFTLRQRMLNAVQNLEYYMMVEVIEPNWLVFLANMSKVKNIDDVLECHDAFLLSCMKDCMLTTPGLLATVGELMNVCIKYCQFIQFPDVKSDSESNDEGQSEQTFKERIDKFDYDFTAILVGLLNRIRDLGRESNNEKMISVLYRLDFNNFYSTKILQMAQLSISSVVDTSG